MTEITTERRDGVGILMLNAPDRRNALTPQMARDMLTALDELDGDPAIGAVVIGGEGRAFCAGAHLATLSGADADPASEESYRAIGDVYEAFVRVTRMRVPTIAAVAGSAVGAGLNLALCTDLRIVAHGARLMSGFGPLGLHPGGGHFTLLTRWLGREAATAVGVFEAELSGDRAVELGMAWEAHEQEVVRDRACELAARVADDPPLARALIASFRQEAERIPLGVAVQAERASQMWSLRRRARD